RRYPGRAGGGGRSLQPGGGEESERRRCDRGIAEPAGQDAGGSRRPHRGRREIRPQDRAAADQPARRIALCGAQAELTGQGGVMGIVVICSYRMKPCREEEARTLVARHVPTLRAQDLITPRPAILAEGGDGVIVEIFEWASEEKSRSAPTIPEIGALWK